MVRTLKWFYLLAILTGSLQYAGAFALIGPNNEAYQSPEIGYNPNPFIDGQTIGPKNLGEEYRRNTPVLYYSFDQNFLDFFGSNGVAAVDAAFQVMNGLAETNLSSYSADLSEFPMEAMRVNYRAQALGLSDLKSTTMNLLMEQMGLTHPDRYVWTIHGREHFGTPPCPVGMQYLVIKRNFDPVMGAPDQLLPTSYVNGTLYTYRIVEYCTTAFSPIPPLLADATEFPVDPLATTFTAVAAGNIAPILYGGIAFNLNAGLLVGTYYTGLTRDDLGGLRYLMRTNNMNIEDAGVDTVTFITNTTPQLLFTSNLTELVEAALTNGPAALGALFPNIRIGNSTAIFTNVVTTNTIFYLTNVPFAPNGVAVVRSAVVLTTNIATYFKHEFLNVYITPQQPLLSNFQIPIVPGHTRTNGTITYISTNVSTEACSPFTPSGSICTNVTSQSVTVNSAFGDYYILPTNLCDVAIISTQLVTVITISGNTFVATNAPGTTNTQTVSFSITPNYNYTQYAYVIRPVTCPENTVALRQGIEKVRFIRRDFDSLLNQFFYPETNDYVLNAITNSTLIPQKVRRSVFAPDILFTASDQAGGPGSTTLNALSRNIPFDQGNTLPNLAGPGTITPGVAIDFNKVGPIYGNVYPNLGEDTQIPLLIWGTFDGSTNAPIVYPNGASIVSLENQVLIQVSPGGLALPDGIVGANYTNVFGGFSATGGTAPYTWGLATGSPGLPPGLSLNPVTGTISGVATTANVYDFVLRMTDAVNRFVDRPYTITVNP